MWRATGESKFEDAAYDMLLDINEHCRTTCGFAALKNVKMKEKADYMESFFLVKIILINFNSFRFIFFFTWERTHKSVKNHRNLNEGEKKEEMGTVFAPNASSLSLLGRKN